MNVYALSSKEKNLIRIAISLFHSPTVRPDDSDSNYTKRIKEFIRAFAPSITILPSGATLEVTAPTMGEQEKLFLKNPKIREIFYQTEDSLLHEFAVIYNDLIKNGILKQNELDSGSSVDRPDIEGENPNEVIAFFVKRYGIDQEAVADLVRAFLNSKNRH